MRSRSRMMRVTAVVLLAIAAMTLCIAGVSQQTQAAGQNLFRSPVGTPNVAVSYGDHPVGHGWYLYGYGLRNSRGLYHTGVHFKNVHGCYGKPVYATARGQVALARYDSYWGYVIVIKHRSAANPGRDCYSLYANLSRIAVSQSQYVNQMQFIGRIGSTGMSCTTGPALHFEIKSQRNVELYGRLGYQWTTYPPNSYGYVDPWRYCIRY